MTVPLSQDARGMIGFLNGKPAAAAVMDHWLPGSVEIHQVIENPFILRHEWFEAVAEAAYGERRQSIYGVVSEGCSKAIKLNLHLGFRETGRIPNGAKDGIDLVVLTLARGECRFLKESINELR